MTNHGQQMNKSFLFFSFVFICHFYGDTFAANSLLKPMKFQKTASDATFTQRTENSATGYAPYTNTSAFKTIKIESESEYLNRMLSHAEHQHQQDLTTLSATEYCDKYSDPELCAPESTESLIAIGNRQPTYTQPSNIIGYSEFNTPVISSTFAHNGPCTKPQHSDHFPNKILTSGTYKQSDPAFEKAMITTFRTEGECVNNPSDSGGYTCYGISQNNNPEIDVKSITRADAERIAHNKYYLQYGFNLLPDYIRGDVFMLGWGVGPITSIHYFCKVLGIPARDKIDATVVAAAENYNGDLHNDFLDAQQQLYTEISKQGNNKIFLKGWMRSIQLRRENGCHSPTPTPILRQ